MLLQLLARAPCTAVRMRPSLHRDAPDAVRHHKAVTDCFVRGARPARRRRGDRAVHFQGAEEVGSSEGSSFRSFRPPMPFQSRSQRSRSRAVARPPLGQAVDDRPTLSAGAKGQVQVRVPGRLTTGAAHALQGVWRPSVSISGMSVRASFRPPLSSSTARSAAS